MEPNNPIDRVTTHAPSRTWRNNSNQRTENPKMAKKANYEFSETPNGTATLTARCENIIIDEGHFRNTEWNRHNPTARALQLNDVPSQ